MSNLVRRTDNALQNASFPDGAGRPLGTADWFRFAPGQTPTFRKGDLWLSRLPTGEPVGYRDDRHVLVCSGPRSGKGTSILVPNLLLWPGSVVVIDPKGENAVITARRRGKGSAYSYGLGQKVHLLDPFSEVRGVSDTMYDLRASYNPLDQLGPEQPEAVEDANRIAAALIVEQSKEPFWENAAQGILAKLCLHVRSWKRFGEGSRNLLTVRRLAVEGETDLRAMLALNTDPKKLPSSMALLFEEMSRNTAYGGVVAQTGRQLLNMETGAPKMLFSILQVIVTNTDFMEGEGMKDCLANSSFSIRSLKTDPAGVSLYLCLPQRYMPTHFRWLRMMTTLILNEMERTRHQPASGHPVLMMLDEFAGLKRMSVIENAAAQISGYGVKMMLVVQSLAQLKEVYRDNWETLVATAGTKIFFGNDDHFTREYVSKLIGDHEVVRTTWSESVTKGASLAHASGVSQSESHSVGRSETTTFNTSSRGLSHGWSSGTTQTSGQSFSTSRTSTTTDSESRTIGRSQTIHKRALLTPDEVGRMFGDRSDPKALVLVSGMHPLALSRIHYFRDQAFFLHFDPHPDHPPPMSRGAYERKLAAEKEAERQRRRKAHAEAVQNTIQYLEEGMRYAAAAKVAAIQRRENEIRLNAEIALARKMQRRKVMRTVMKQLLCLAAIGGLVMAIRALVL